MLGFALANLLSRPMRTALSVLGLTVAIAGMVGLFSIAEGISNVVTRSFQQIPGLLIQQRGAPVPIFSTLPSAWEQEIREVPGVTVVNAEVLSRINLLEGKVVLSPPRFLLGLEIPSRLALQRCVYHENLVEGRFLTLEDQGTNNCIISRQIAIEHKKGIGDTLLLNRAECPIVGIYHTGSIMIDVSILMDLGTVRQLMRVAPDTVSCFYVELAEAADRKQVKQELEDLFRGREGDNWQPSGQSSENILGSLFRQLDRQIRQTAPGDLSAPSSPPLPATNNAASDVESPVEVRSAEDWSERFDEFSADLKVFLVIMTAIGVTIAVLSIINTMLMSITERTTDFGILRANGWRSRDIVKLITWESALIGLIGGGLGALLGLIATLVINATWPDRMQLFASPQLLIFSVLFSVLLGTIGGVYPAWLASRLSPMEAIRRG